MAPVHPADRLYEGQALTPGERLTSSDGRFNLILQSDGNLVLYDPHSRSIWASGTDNHPSVSTMVMQPDGNLVLYENNSHPYWASNTSGDASVPSIVMQSDGNLVMYSAGQSYWSTKTDVPATPNRPAHSNVLDPGEGLSIGDSLTSADGNFRLTLQSDGNLVESSQSPNSDWASNTSGRLSWSLIMQGDGNLVLYDVHKNPIWTTNTSGHGGVGMIIQDDGNMVIYPVGGTQAIWASGAK
jgi:hypothetical protein